MRSIAISTINWEKCHDENQEKYDMTNGCTIERIKTVVDKIIVMVSVARKWKASDRLNFRKGI